MQRAFPAGPVAGPCLILRLIPGLILGLFLVSCSSPPAASRQNEVTVAGVVAEPGTSQAKLGAVIDRLFTDPALHETRAVIVMANGRRVAERYAPGYHENTRFISWSMAKTITGVMIGQLVADGRLRLDESVPVAAWQRSGDPRGEITLRQLLQMRSGLRHTEAGDPVYESSEVEMLFLGGREDMAAHAEAQPLEAEPGRHWEYSSATTIILADLAARALTTSRDPAERRRAVKDYLTTRLFEPIGMTSMIPEFDHAGTLIGSSLMHASARDWARFGEFLRNRGSVAGAQLVPQAWIDFMVSAAPGHPGYGAQIWLNRGREPGQGGPFPGAPSSAFSMNGHLGQYVLVSPGQGLTIVRLGHTPDGQGAPVKAALGRIASLYSGSRASP